MSLKQVTYTELRVGDYVYAEKHINRNLLTYMYGFLILGQIQSNYQYNISKTVWNHKIINVTLHQDCAYYVVRP